MRLIFAGAGVRRRPVIQNAAGGRRPRACCSTIASESEVTMKVTAAQAVALDSTVAEPRGPNTVCEPMPPNAPARSAALPLCRRTTMNQEQANNDVDSRKYVNHPNFSIPRYRVDIRHASGAGRKRPARCVPRLAGVLILFQGLV